jgi:hypothetical protein
METIKVKPWSKDQGDYVLINAEDFDESKHERYINPTDQLEQADSGKKKGK